MLHPDAQAESYLNYGQLLKNNNKIKQAKGQFQHYLDKVPESLIGKLVPILANLKPVKLMGVESQGMILAVDVNGKPILLHPDREVPAGSRVR